MPFQKELCATCIWQDPVSTSCLLKFSCNLLFMFYLIDLLTFRPSEDRDNRNLGDSPLSSTVFLNSSPTVLAKACPNISTFKYLTFTSPCFSE